AQARRPRRRTLVDAASRRRAAHPLHHQGALRRPGAGDCLDRLHEGCRRRGAALCAGPIQGAGDGRLRPLRLPPAAALVLRGRSISRGRGESEGVGRRSAFADETRRGGDQQVRHRPGRTKSRAQLILTIPLTSRAKEGASVAKIDINVPDIGDFKDVPVIEVLVKPGDMVKVDQSLITLESDKATMDVPSTVAGKVVDVVTKVGDKVSMGTLIARIDADGAGAAAAPAAAPAKVEAAPPPAEPPPPPAAPAAPAAAPAPAPAPGPAKPDFSGVFAGPAVRRLARELDIDLNKIKG